MIIGMVLFAVLGTGLTALRVVRRQRLPAIASLLGSACAEMGYASAVMRMPSISVIAAVVGISGSAVLWIAMRPSPLSPEPAPGPRPPRRPVPYRQTIARAAMLIMPTGGIIAGIVGPSAGPAVFGAVWLTLSLWFVVIRPWLRKRPRTVYERPS